MDDDGDLAIDYAEGPIYMATILPGDMSRATVAEMTTQVYVGDDVAYLTAEWRGEPGKWKLRKIDLEP